MQYSLTPFNAFKDKEGTIDILNFIHAVIQIMWTSIVYIKYTQYIYK